MIFVCGDTHYRIDISKLGSKRWPEGKKLTKNDYLIVCGDFGLIWYPEKTKKEESLISWYNEKPWTTLFIDGNHENFDRLLSDEFPEIEMFNSKVKQISNSIFYLQRGCVYTIEDKTFFTFGGGESIDKLQRTEGISWWKEELPTWKDNVIGISILEQFDNCVDYIITHSCSNEMFEEISKHYDFGYKRNTEKSLRDFFSWVEENVQFKHWFFGHFHDDIMFEKHSMLYENKPISII